MGGLGRINVWVRTVRLRGYWAEESWEREVEVYSLKLCRYRYSMNAMVLLPCSSCPSPGFAPYIPWSLIQTCPFGHPSSYSHNSELPFLPMINLSVQPCTYPRVFPTPSLTRVSIYPFWPLSGRLPSCRGLVWGGRHPLLLPTIHWIHRQELRQNICRVVLPRYCLHRQKFCSRCVHGVPTAPIRKTARYHKISFT